MKLIKIAAVAGAAMLVAAAANAQGVDFSKVEIKTTDLGHNTYRLEGQGGNITVAVGTDGIIMVDGQFAPLHDKIKAAVAAISPLPIKYLISTHYHGDHAGGNEAVRQGRRRPSSHRTTSGSGSPPAPPTSSTETRRRRHRRAPSRP